MRRAFTVAIATLLVLAAGVVPASAASGTAGAAQADCSFPVTSTDATGTEITIEERPERITTLSPSAAQTMWELGAESQVVGVTQYAGYLDGAGSRTNVSGAGQNFISVESVVSTESDLVIAPNVVPNSTVQQLREAGQTVYKMEFAASVDDVIRKTELFGELTGNCEAASETATSMRERISTVREAVENSDRPGVFASQGGGWTAGSGTFIGNMVELAGGSNVAADANVSGYGQMSEEVIVTQDPEWIVQIGPLGTYPRTEAYNGTHAVRNGQILTVASENVSQPAPRVVDAVVKMAEAFHPEAYAEANATTVETTTQATTAATATDLTTTATEQTATEAPMQEETTTESDESSGGVPGFGVPAAVVALAGAALLARRR